jgi:hypothetical protein
MMRRENGGSCTVRSLIDSTHPQTSLGRSSQGVGRAYGKHGRGQKSAQGFGGKARRKETTRKTLA